MPYIKKIELKGFKSFGPQTVKIELDRGFMVVTGPNGSGKSNIVDALLFALGELSTKRLRAETASKLIFQGSEEAGLEKARMAKVTVQFDNSDGRIPVDTATVTVSREVYRDGQSVYRLNGRRISRVHLMEILSMAGISSTSQNIILQGTITRLTDISTPERRKIIEDLVGIAQYDAEKAEAEEKLREADMAIRTAMGRIEEVQRRVEDLERERNELLRYNFLKNEIKKLEAVKISHDISRMQEKMAQDYSQMEQLQKRHEQVRTLREQYRLKRREIEEEWRKLSSEIVEGGGSQVYRIQVQIGDLKSRIAELTTKITSNRASLDGLNKVRENILQQHQALRDEIRDNRLKIRQLKKEHESVQKDIDAKQAEHDALAQEIAQLWSNISENSKKLREKELQLDKLYRRLAYLKSEHAKSQTAIKVREKRFQDLGKRREHFTSTLEELSKSSAELEKFQKEQRAQLRELERLLERRIAQKEAVEQEMAEAGKIAGSAREAVIEFATQRELAETIAAEEKALRSIEELGELGVIQGVYGRLRNLIRIDKEYSKAIEVAAGGWLDAIVVKDFDTAFTCAETLRKMKLGRIKIIPLKEITNIKPIKIPEGKNITGAASSFIKCSSRFEQAVQFVFGDTLIVPDGKTAFELSNEGYRVVTVDGDLYEPGGALEGGFYRAPIDFSAIIPSETAIKSLEEAVSALQKHLARREDYVASLEEEIDRIRVEIARLSEVMSTIDREIARVKRSIMRTKANLRRVESGMKRLKSEMDAEKAKLWSYRAERSSIQKEIRQLQLELAALRRMVDPAAIQEMEVKREKLAEELITLRQKLGTIETRISTLQSQFDNVLRTGYKNVKIQLAKVDQQLKQTEVELQAAIQERDRLNVELADLERQREALSKSVASVREESKKYTSQIDDIDRELRKIDAEYEEVDRLLTQYKLNVQTCQIQLEQWKNQLKQLGYDVPLKVTAAEVEEAETSLKMLNFEIDRIGAVNQLAPVHYADQISRYKELSVRLNELEKEKQAIIRFMEEVEGRKLKAFMEAFEKINQNLQKYFSKLTGGGTAALVLENPETPFAGGVDMIVQFPRKPAIVVGGASGGERSVAAVAFLFAIKEFSPASFYVFDEVDAHLDAFHVSKLADLFLEESEKAQFIVITLKPEVVNKAQKVYGVYGLNGVSKVVLAKFLEAKS
ncbi:MAG: chromosome segregation protein SMC [Candidatus Bathyarchaeota archaeon]|nr:chromosome segregation protein SMC [Candidatus Bathyarchaeota archaeon]